MPKTNIIISSLGPELYTTKRLMSEAKKLKYSVSYINPYEFHLPLKIRPLKGIYFHRTTGTNYDDFDLLVTEHHALQGMLVSNPLESLKLFRAKDLQSLFFKQHKLPAIETVLYRGKMNEELKEEICDLSPSKKFILKMTRGNQGIGVNFLESAKSLLSILETFYAMKDQRFLIQPYVEHTKEWRLFVIRNEIVACIEKTLSKADFRGNSKRSEGKLLKSIPSELKNLALQSFSKSKLDYAGIDILQTKKGDFIILEINAIAGFEQAEALSGKNIARELLNIKVGN